MVRGAGDWRYMKRGSHLPVTLGKASGSLGAGVIVRFPPHQQRYLLLHAVAAFVDHLGSGTWWSPCPITGQLDLIPAVRSAFMRIVLSVESTLRELPVSQP